MKVNVMHGAGGGAQSELQLSEAVFGAAFNEPLIHQIVVAYQAAGREGTRAQKNRAAVSGGGAKPWKQKGTGRARAGSIRSPLWRGGGKVFPASTQNFEQKVNRKMVRGGLRAILSELLRQGRLLAIDELRLDAPKTRGLAERLKGLGAENALIVLDNVERNMALSARNLPHVQVVDVAHADPVSLIGHEKVVMTVGAIKRFEELLA